MLRNVYEKNNKLILIFPNYTKYMFVGVPQTIKDILLNSKSIADFNFYLRNNYGYVRLV
jgi:hypothetical protein